MKENEVNLPVPAGERAPKTARWYLLVAPPAAIIWLYRLYPAEKRAGWNDGVPTSHEAMAAVLAPDGGWKAFRKYTKPQLKARRQPAYVMAWALFLLSVVFGLNMAEGQSWAN